MANPNNAIGTNGAFGGRTSVNAFNDALSSFSGRGIVSGWSCTPSSGLTVSLGGNGNVRDVAIAEDGSGNKTTVNNISQSPIQATVNAAPASNSRVDAIVVYIEDSPSGDGVTDNPDVVNLLVVSGTVASTPSRPTDSAIRTAITADGASGSTAYYVVLAYVTIPTGTTDIDTTMISAGDQAVITNNAVDADSIADGSIPASKLDFTTMPGNYSTSEAATPFTWIDGKTIYKKTIVFGTLPNSTVKTVSHGISNPELFVKIETIVTNGNPSDLVQQTLPFASNSSNFDNTQLTVTKTDLSVDTKSEYWANFTGYITLFYTKVNG